MSLAEISVHEEECRRLLAESDAAGTLLGEDAGEKDAA
jgi:hypothetical protein